MHEEIRHEKKPVIKLATSNHDDVSSQITDLTTINSLLRKLQKRHSLLTAHFANKWQPASTMLLEINLDEKYLVIDEFCPLQVNEESANGTKIRITGSNAGVSITFDSHIIDASEKNGNPYYKIPFPESIEYCERRQAHRVPVNISNPIKINFINQNDTLMHGELRDISLGGFSARLKDPIIENLEIGDLIPKCILQIPATGRIVCSAELRRKFEVLGTGIIIYGFMFDEMNPQDRRELEQLVAKMERNLMKMMKRD